MWSQWESSLFLTSRGCVRYCDLRLSSSTWALHHKPLCFRLLFSIPKSESWNSQGTKIVRKEFAMISWISQQKNHLKSFPLPWHNSQTLRKEWPEMEKNWGKNKGIKGMNLTFERKKRNWRFTRGVSPVRSSNTLALPFFLNLKWGERKGDLSLILWKLKKKKKTKKLSSYSNSNDSNH